MLTMRHAGSDVMADGTSIWRKRTEKSGSYSAAVSTMAAVAPSARSSRARSTLVIPPMARIAWSHAPALRQAIISSTCRAQTG